jgi:thiamine biosynthesis lipoprotein
LFNRPLIPILLILLVALLVWLRQPGGESMVSRTALVMGTLVEIKAYGEDRDRLEGAIDAAFAEMVRLEQLFSSHLAESEISRLSAATGPFAVSRETADLLALGIRMVRLSAGAFDLGLGRLKDLWDISGENPQIPGEQALRRALQGTGPDALLLEGQQVRKQAPDLQIDLGGIAKGFIVDRAAELLLRAGVSSAAVNAGGDIRLLGDRQGQDWRIGIHHPRESGAILATLNLRNRAVVTSGDYERFFVRDGVRYHHLFDPQTGRPARGCQSVTVVAADAASADALATAAFVLGPHRGLDLLEQLPDVEGLLVTADGRRLATAGIESVLEWH